MNDALIDTRIIGWPIRRFMLCLLAVALGVLTVGNAQAARAELAELRARIADQQFIEAVTLGLELQTEAQRNGDVYYEAKVFQELAVLFYDTDNPDQSLVAAQSGLDALADEAPSAQYGELMYWKIRALSRLGRFEEAGEAAQRLIRIGNELDDQKVVGQGTHLYAGYFFRTNRVEEAASLLAEAREIFRAAGYMENYGKANNDFAMSLKARDRHDEALVVFDELLQLAIENDFAMLEVYALLELGDINRILAKMPLADDYLTRALAISEDHENLNWQVFSHMYLSALYKDTGDTERALRHSNALAATRGAQTVQRAEARVAKLEIEQLVTAHDHQMQLLEKEREIAELALVRSRATILAMALGTILLGLMVTILYRNSRKQEVNNEQLAESNRALDKQASTDVLTGLGNRRALQDYLETMRVKASDYALILLDLDHFKRINDAHGHDHGDIVLVEIAKRIGQRLRGTDLAVRWGGEEFLVLLSDTDRSRAYAVANDLHQQIQKTPVRAGEIHHQVTATFGVATSTDYRSFDDVLKGADQALSLGKRSGRNMIAIQDTSAGNNSVRPFNLVA